jgi:hypothetical protein
MAVETKPVLTLSPEQDAPIPVMNWQDSPDHMVNYIEGYFYSGWRFAGRLR